MKKIFTALFCLSVIGAVFAEPVKLDGSWYLNTWSGYNPLPKMTTAKDGSISFTEVKGKYGFGILNRKRLTVKAGDTVKFTAVIKGKGKIFLQLQNYDAQGRWTGVAGRGIWIDIPADWKEITMTQKVIDINKKITAATVVTTGTGKGHELQIKNATAEVIPAPAKKAGK